mgnify:CR=1 FL=1
MIDHPNIYDTGRVCPRCGEHILAFRMFYDGRVREFEKPCACRDAEIKAEDAENAARKHEAARQARRQWAEIPEMFSAATLKGYRRLPGTEQAFETLKDYLLNREENFQAGCGLILMGAVGCGKTHLGCAILNCALENGYCAAYWNVPQQLELLMPGNASDTDQMHILDKAMLAHVLLLDDLGAEKSSEWTRKELMIILDERYRGQKPTIITSNLMLTDDELRQTCGDRAYSRLCSDHYQAVALTAADYRRKKS